ncbi:Metallo-dependent phosphatase-like protein [Gongronella butleri]|nr:Metallo-dependent phosphatase-like protein [Gongronella butleri]
MSSWLFSSKLIQRRLVVGWRVAWVLLLFFGEWMVFRQAIRGCLLPARTAIRSPGHVEKAERIVFVADPQITDFYSYDRSPMLLWWTEVYSDMYMRRSYAHLLRQQRPDIVVFVGDLMDGGREWKDDDDGWHDEMQRFFRLFPRQANMIQLYTSGNHDIGISTGIQRHVYDRFRRAFGPLSAVQPLAHNHTLLTVDTVALTSTDDLVRLEAEKVLAQWVAPPPPPSRAMLGGRDPPPHPQTMLVSHVPLHRPELTDCGPFRKQSRASIYQHFGYQYQNLLDASLSSTLLNRVQPNLVFSGDDHDFCQVTHTYGGGSDATSMMRPQQQPPQPPLQRSKQRQATEFTVPTFSMAQGVRRPGYMWVHATPEGLVPQLCWLPDQLRIFMVYGWAGALTMLTLLASRLWSHERFTHFQAIRMDRIKRDEEAMSSSSTAPRPSSPSISIQINTNGLTTTTSSANSPRPSLQELALAVGKDILQVAVVAIPFYLFCILAL